MYVCVFQVSYRLILFHVHFLNFFRGFTLNGTRMSIHHAHAVLSEKYGRVNGVQEIEFQRVIHSLRHVRSWESFFAYTQLSVPSDTFLLNWLRISVFNSVRRRYYRNDAVKSMMDKYIQKTASTQARARRKATLASESLADVDEDGNPVERSHAARKALLMAERMEQEATKCRRSGWC